MNIVLLGYMASGKTTLGGKLAEKLDYNFIDLDDVIEDNEKTSIQNIFKLKGEIYFRKKESYYLNKVLNNNDDMVLSLGGGTPCYGNNMTSLLNALDTKTIYLKAAIPTLVERLINEKSKRPLISHIQSEEALTEFIGKHLFERTQYYNLANLIVTIDKKTEQEIVKNIILELF
jgi:shikimate kinase